MVPAHNLSSLPGSRIDLPQKPAFQIAEKLLAAGKEVHVVNPRETAGRCFTSLKDCPQPIDVVDLVIRFILLQHCHDVKHESFAPKHKGFDCVLRSCHVT